MQVDAGRGRGRHNTRSMILPRIALLFAFLSLAGAAFAARPLQPWLDTALAGATIRLPPGIYQGPAVISKPITLEGDGKVIIDAGGKGTVLTSRPIVSRCAA